MKRLKLLLAPTLALFLIGVVVTAALSVTNFVTKDRIAAQNEESLAKAMAQLIPQAEFTLTYEDTQTNLTYYHAMQNGQLVGGVVRSSAMGYKSEIQVLTAFDKQNKVTGVAVTDCADESPGIGQKVGTDQSFLDQYVGYHPQQNSVDAITGATYSSDAVTQAVDQAILFVSNNSFPINEQTEGGANQ